MKRPIHLACLVAALAFVGCATDEDSDTGDTSTGATATATASDVTEASDLDGATDATAASDSAVADASGSTDGEVTDTTSPSDAPADTDASAPDDAGPGDATGPGDVAEDADTSESFVPTTWVEDCLGGIGRSDARFLIFDAPDARIAIVRSIDPDAIGTSGTKIFLADGFAFESADAAVCVTDLAALEYSISHHNFADALVATPEPGHVFRLTMDTEGYEFPWQDEVTWTIDGETAFGPRTLEFVSCTPLDQNGLCQFGRRQ